MAATARERWRWTRPISQARTRTCLRRNRPSWQRRDDEGHDHLCCGDPAVHADVGVALLALQPVAQDGPPAGNEDEVAEPVLQRGMRRARAQPALAQDLVAPDEVDPVCQPPADEVLELRLAARADVGVG